MYRLMEDALSAESFKFNRYKSDPILEYHLMASSLFVPTTYTQHIHPHLKYYCEFVDLGSNVSE